MRYPVNYIGVTNNFHQGLCLDFGWNNNYGGKNQPIFACADGIVKKVEFQNKGGNVIYIEHYDGIVSCYAHLDNKDILVKKDDYVKLGDQIGLMGTTGSSSTGNHLHFGLFTSINVIYKDSTLNPFDYLRVYDNQIVSTTTENKYPIKYYNPEIIEYKYVYNVDYEGLNVRSSASLTSPIVDILETSTRVEVQEEKNNFTKIDTNKWVYTKYLSNNVPEYKVVKELENPPLNVRSGPSTKYNIINTLNTNDKVQVYETKGTWSKVSPNEEAWVSSKYIN